MTRIDRALRVALVAGTLGKGGAEKQLVYIAQALLAANVDVRVYCLTRGEFYESALRDLGLNPTWIGYGNNPLCRLGNLMARVGAFRPHILQSAHFYTNLYVALAAPVGGAMAVGSLRNDAIHEVESNGRWGRWLLRLPPVLVANSGSARRNAALFGVASSRVQVLSNVIDLRDYDQCSLCPLPGLEGLSSPMVMTVCRLVAAKRLDRFLEAVRLAAGESDLRAVIVGDGPERGNLESMARKLGLMPDRVRFLGWRDDVAGLIRRADMLAVTSDHEGFPNVVLEAMACGVPVVATPAGDIPAVVQEGQTGFVVPFGDVAGLARHMANLSRSPELRSRMSSAARNRVEQCHSLNTLAGELLRVYRSAAQQQHDHRLLGLLPA